MPCHIKRLGTLGNHGIDPALFRKRIKVAPRRLPRKLDRWLDEKNAEQRMGSAKRARELRINQKKDSPNEDGWSVFCRLNRHGWPSHRHALLATEFIHHGVHRNRSLV